jgi:hypothetical protein
MQTANYNHNDFANTSEADKGLLVKYFYKERPDSAASAENGYPTFKEVPYIEIRIPGQRDAQACRPASEADNQRFPAHYKAFLDRVEAPIEGMPLAEWPQVTRSQVEALAFNSIKTVEQLAAVSDTNISGFMGGYGLKAKAQKWLEMNSAETVDREKEEMRETIADMQAQIAELLAGGVVAVEDCDTDEPDMTKAEVLETAEKAFAGQVEASANDVADAVMTKPKRKSRRKPAPVE